MTQRVVVIGGGIAGLAAAYRAHALGADSAGTVEVILLESDQELGGKVRTAEHDGHLFEHGPNAFLDPEPALKELIEISGVEVLRADAAAKRRYLCRDRKLHELSSNPAKLMGSGLLPLTAVMRLLGEVSVGPRRSDHGNRPSEGWGDESVEAFITRRFGAKAAALFAAPLVSGVFAGDPRRLSLSACFPKIAALETEHGSLLKAMRARQRSGQATPTLHTPRGGMQSLPRALTDAAPFQIRSGAHAERITSEGGRWAISLRGAEQIAADALIISTPAAAAASLLEPHAPAIATHLSKIRSPHLAVVNLIYPPEQAQRVPTGFGALHAADNTSELLGVLHESHIFPERTPSSRLHLRAMLGGSTRPELAERSDQEILGLATEELTRLHGLGAPLHAEVTRWSESIPQYHLGHARLIADVEQALTAVPSAPIVLVGNYLHGVSLSDTAASGRGGAESVMAQLAP